MSEGIEPDLDVVRSPLYRVYTSVVGVEVETVAAGICAGDTTSCAIGAGVDVVCAIASLEVSCFGQISGENGRPCGRLQGSFPKIASMG